MCERNRMIVQRGLELRAAKRREENSRKAEMEREAAYEAADREMRREINFRSKWASVERSVSKSDDQRTRIESKQRAIHRECQAKRASNWRLFLLRNFECVIVALIANALYAVGGIEIWISLPVMIMALIYCVMNYLAYMKRNSTRKQIKRISRRRAI